MVSKPKLTIFLSWSGPMSRKLADFLREWLEKVVPGVNSWMSQEDIRRGSEWFPALMRALQNAHASIICVTPENVLSPWIHFEAGCLATQLSKGFVCPYLLGLNPSELGNLPLSVRQSVNSQDENSTWGLVKTVNALLGENAYDDAILLNNFKPNWEFLKKQTRRVDGRFPKSKPPSKLYRPNL